MTPQSRQVANESGNLDSASDVLHELSRPADALTLPPVPGRPYDPAVVPGLAAKYGIEF